MSEIPKSTGECLHPPAGEQEVPDVAERARALEEVHEAGKEKGGTHHHLTTATAVSVAAAIVSIVSAGYTYFHGREQDRHNRRIELTNIVEKLVSLQDNENDEYAILAKLAPRLVGEVSDEVSGPEYSIIARALVYSGDTSRALDYGRAAVDKAENTNDFTWALRQLGWTLMQSGAPDEGKATYSRALEVFGQKNIDESQPWVKTDKAYTYADWGQIAAIIGHCNESGEARAALAALLPEVIFPGDQKSLLAKSAQLDLYFAACRPGITTPIPPDGKASAAGSR